MTDNTPSPVQEENQNNEQPNILAHEQKQYYFQGPLPAPQILEKYNEVIPNAAERILTMAEKDADFQREITHKAIELESNERRLGQILGFCIGCIALSLSAVSLFLGYPTTASIIGGTTVVGLVTVFVTGRSLKEQKEDNRHG